MAVISGGGEAQRNQNRILILTAVWTAIVYAGWMFLKEEFGSGDLLSIALLLSGFAPLLIWSLIDYRFGLVCTIIASPLLDPPQIPHSIAGSFGDIFAFSTISGYFLFRKVDEIWESLKSIWRNEYFCLVIIIFSSFLSLFSSRGNWNDALVKLGFAEIGGLILMMLFMAILVQEISRGGYLGVAIKACAASLVMVVAFAFFGLPDVFFCIEGYGVNGILTVNSALKSTLGNPNYVGSFIAAAIPLVLLNFCYSPWGSSRNILYVASAILISVLAILTISRSAVVGLAFSIFGFAVITKLARKSFLIVVPVSLIIALYPTFWSVGLNACARKLEVAGFVRKELILSQSQGEVNGQSEMNVDGGILVRMKLAENAIEAWKSSPVTGVGIGLLQNYSAVDGQKNRAHNIYLTILAEQGVFGLLAWASWGIGLLLALTKAFRSTGYRLELKFLALSLIAVFIQGMAMDYYRMTWIWVVFALVLSAQCWSSEKKSAL